MSDTTAKLTGTPPATGSFTFTIKLTDQVEAKDDQILSLVVTEPFSMGPLEIVTTALSDGQLNSPYVALVMAMGGSPPYKNWQVVSGTLPQGLVINPTTGLVSGTPTGTFTAPVTSTFTVQVSDSADPPDKVTEQFSLTVNPPGYPACAIWGPIVVPVGERFVVSWSNTPTLNNNALTSLGWKDAKTGGEIVECTDSTAMPDCSAGLHQGGRLPACPPEQAATCVWGGYTLASPDCQTSPDELTCNGIWMPKAGVASVSVQATNTLGMTRCAWDVVAQDIQSGTDFTSP
jgi:hypothetical protein